MSTRSQPWRKVTASGKPKKPPNIIPIHGTIPNPLPGQKAIHYIKMRTVLMKKQKVEQFNVGIETHDLIERMFDLDNGIIEIVSTKNAANTFSNITNFPKEEEAYLDFFEIKSFTKHNGDTSITIYFTIKTTTEHTLNKMKKNTDFTKFTKTHNMYPYEHPFQSQQLARIGFFCGISNRDIHTEDFYTNVHEILTQTAESSLTTHIVPIFAINTNLTRHSHITNGVTEMHTTEALEIECEVESIAPLTELIIQSQFDKYKFGEFIPFTAHINDPELLIQKIADNNYFKTTFTTIHLHGIHPEVMADKLEDNYTVISALLSNPEIFSVEKTYKSESHGKWTIITSNEFKDYTLQLVQDILTPVIELATYSKHLNDNEDYKAGVRATRYAQAPLDFSSHHIQTIRNNTTFLPPAANRRFSRVNNLPRPRPPTGTITFSQNPPNINTPRTSTDAWQNSRTSMNTIQNPNPQQHHNMLNTTTVQPTQQQRSPTHSNTSSLASHATESSAITVLSQQVAALSQRVTELSRPTQSTVTEQATQEAVEILQTDVSEIKVMMRQILINQNNINNQNTQTTSLPIPQIITTTHTPALQTNTTVIIPPTETTHNNITMSSVIQNSITNNATSTTDELSNNNPFPRLQRLPLNIIHQATRLSSLSAQYSSVTQIGRVIQNLNTKPSSSPTQDNRTFRNTRTSHNTPPSPDNDTPIRHTVIPRRRRSIIEEEEVIMQSPERIDANESIMDNFPSPDISLSINDTSTINLSSNPIDLSMEDMRTPSQSVPHIDHPIPINYLNELMNTIPGPDDTHEDAMSSGTCG